MLENELDPRRNSQSLDVARMLPRGLVITQDVPEATAFRRESPLSSYETSIFIRAYCEPWRAKLSKNRQPYDRVSCT